MLFHPFAKINLGLNVVARRSDGYHELETVFYPVPSLNDDLEITPLPAGDATVSLTVEGTIATGATDDNLVTKAYRLLARDYKLPPVRVRLVKRIPTQAGLGGGSADGAATLVMLNDLFTLQLGTADLRQYALRLGADCPFFIDPKPSYAEGVGERLEPITLDLSNYNLAILKPPFAVSTKIAFAGIHVRHPEHNVRHIVTQPVETWRDTLCNDFETTVFAAHNELAGIKQRLYDNGAVYASMTGSGSAIFALFTLGHRPSLSDALTAAFPMCDVFVTRA